MLRRLMVVLFGVLLIAGLAACGDDGGIEEETAPTQDEADGEDEGGLGGGGDEPTDDDEPADVDLPDGQSPGDLGSERPLDDLADGCFEGDLTQCDLLYGLSEDGSDYQLYGDTCAGRQDSGTGEFCTEVFDFLVPDGQSPGDLGNDDELDELADECFDGDLGACDELYAESPVGSSYETYGITCGGRQPVSIADDLIELAASNESDGPCEAGYVDAS